jgi:hypothetical protein
MIYILVSVSMMALTIFCFRWYIHPGTHKGFMDQGDNSAWVSWKEYWLDTTNVPVNVSSLQARFTRLWFWIVTGLNIKQWSAVHRHNSIHEDKVYPAGKPGSLGRAKLFLKQRKIVEMVAIYAIETPDMLEDQIYQKFPYIGPVIFLLLLLSIFGELGVVMYLAQLAWIPFWCSESANGWKLKSFEENRLMAQLKDQGYYE